MFRSVPMALSLAALGVLLRPAAATEFCVSCEGPNATYRCAVTSVPGSQSTDARAQLQCIRQLAETGGHESCSVTRSAVQDCEGALTVIAAPLPVDADPLAQTPSDQSAETLPAPALPEVSEPGAKKVPNTVEELAGQTVDSSKEGIKQAGDAIATTAEKTGEQIGNAGGAVASAAKKTWKCLTSLFSEC